MEDETAVNEIDNTPTLPHTLPPVCFKRPDISQYTPELFEGICAQLEHGKSLRKACEEAGISKGSFWEWRNLTPEHAARYSQAQEKQGDALFSDMYDDAATLRDRNDWINWAKTKEVDPKMVGAIMRGVDTGIGRALDILKRLNPAKYGDKLDTTNTTTIQMYCVAFNAQGEQVAIAAPPPRNLIDITPESRQEPAKAPRKRKAKERVKPVAK